MEFISEMFRLFNEYSAFFIDGIKNTVVISFFSVLIGSFFGVFMAFARMSKSWILRFPAVAYIDFIRGTPLLIQLMFLFYGLPQIGIRFPEIAFISGSDRFMAGVVAMSLNSCAYVAEIIRAGIQAVDKGQTEAARAMGFSQAQSMKLVILPQAIKNILPALGNEFVTIIKESSVASVIGLHELTFRAGDVRAVTYASLESFGIAAILYYMLTFTMGRLLDFAERKFKNA